ncbi:MAG: Alcohol dehydrogenase GroES-like domain [Methanosarcinales archaeon]|nr:Alcohol dehydrogenase GroES-like domain [Methanosarcinales archaeon]
MYRKAREVQIRKMDTPPCPEDDVLIETKACPICSTDVHMCRHEHRCVAYKVSSTEKSAPVELMKIIQMLSKANP